MFTALRLDKILSPWLASHEWPWVYQPWKWTRHCICWNIEGLKCLLLHNYTCQKNDISTHAISFKICWRTIPFTLKLQVLISNVGFTECHLHHPQFITIFMGDWKIKEPSPNIYIYICICIYHWVSHIIPMIQLSVHHPLLLVIPHDWPMINHDNQHSTVAFWKSKGAPFNHEFWRNVHHFYSGWWFEPSWKIWVRQWEGWHPIYDGKWNSCLKPPTK